MTAIAGFNCIDGIVLAADTEESYGQDKVYTHKLFPIERDMWKLAVAGAGSGYLIDYAKEQIVKAIEEREIYDSVEFEKALRVTMDGLYNNEFKLYPVDHDSERQIQLIVGAQFLDETKAQPVWEQPVLFECQSNLVSKLKRRQGRVFGAGELLKELASGFAYWGIDAELAEWICVYLIHDAKRRYSGVGGKTHTFRIMDDGTFKDRPGHDVRSKEEVFETFSYIVQLLVMSLSPSIPDDKAKDFVDAARKWILDARRDVKQIEIQRKKLRHRTINIQSREIQRLMRRVTHPKRIKLSASQKSEPQQ